MNTPASDLRTQDSYLESLRRLELDALAQWFRPGMKVLEIGGGSGFQAAILSRRGCEVVSIDIYVPPADERYFDVLEYPGFPLPVADQAFDLVYSSHMLYYELDNPRFFSELRRVLKPDGMAIHVMPTCAWRLATCAAYYFYLAKRVPVHFLRMANRHGSAAVAPDRSPANDSSAPRSWWHWIVCMPLDPTSTISKELWAWRRKAVTRVLAGEGFQSISVSSLRLCYTQWALFGKSLSLGVRRVLAYVLGSASVVYVTKRNAG